MLLSMEILDRHSEATSRVMASNWLTLLHFSGALRELKKQPPSFTASPPSAILLVLFLAMQLSRRQFADTHIAVAKMMTRRLNTDADAARLNLTRHDLTCGRRHSLRQLPLSLQCALRAGKVF